MEDSRYRHEFQAILLRQFDLGNFENVVKWRGDKSFTMKRRENWQKRIISIQKYELETLSFWGIEFFDPSKNLDKSSNTRSTVKIECGELQIFELRQIRKIFLGQLHDETVQITADFSGNFRENPRRIEKSVTKIKQVQKI